ncbi:MAG: c-type cytochrome biogenesis protein CcsB [Thermostichales cyanobacterium HHBFW_bins_127]
MLNLVSLQAFLDNTAFAVAFLTLIFYWVGAAWPGIPLLPSLGTAGMMINNLVIATLLGCRWLEAGYFPLSNLYESLFFLAWGMTALHWLGERWSQSRWVGVVTAPVVLGITAFAALVLPAEMQAAAPLVPALQSHWLMMHVTVMLLSYAALLVGSLLSMVFLWVTRAQAVPLRGDSFGVSGGRRDGSAQTLAAPAEGGVAVLTRPVTLTPQRLSLAEILDNTSYRLIGLGFPLLTIGIIAGAVWANEAWGTYWSWDPKETWALITWLVFAAYLHARITKGWQGRRPALLASLGFGVVWVCYLGVNLLGKGLHSYGWFF